jgi:hypothetical protein
MQDESGLEGSTITLRVRSITGQTTELHEVPYDSTVADLKARVSSTLGIPPAVQRLIFAGRELTDNLTINAVRITDNAIVHLVVRRGPEVPPEAQGGNEEQDVEGGVRPGGGAAPPPGDMFSALRLGRVTRMFALLDMFFLILRALAIPVLLAFIVLPGAGFYGAKLFNPWMVCLYVLYLCLSAGVWGYAITLAAKIPDARLIVFYSLGIVLTLAIMYYVVSFVRVVFKMTEEERRQVRDFNAAMNNAVLF